MLTGISKKSHLQKIKNLIYYDQLGVCTAVQTFMINLWKHNKEQPSNFFTESCRDGHPGYPKEYLEYGFPIDWWAIKEIEPGKDFKVYHLRNG